MLKDADLGVALQFDNYRVKAREGHHPGRRLRHPAAPDHPRGQQAAAAGLRQADDLLPAVDADAGRHPRDPDHHHAARSGPVRPPARRRQPSSASTLTYAVQPEPNGLAEAFIIGADHVGSDTAALVLGDNIFYGHGLGAAAAPRRRSSTHGCVLFGYQVRDPERYGVAEADADGTPDLDRGEAGARRSPNLAVTGLYFYDNDVVEIAPGLQPVRARRARDHRPEQRLRRSAARPGWSTSAAGTAWLDTGTHDSLLEAGPVRPGARAPAGRADRLPGRDRAARRASSTPTRPTSSARPWPSPATASTSWPWPLGHANRAYRRVATLADHSRSTARRRTRVATRCAMFSRRAMRSSIGGWVEKRPRTPRVLNGLAIIMWLVFVTARVWGERPGRRARLQLAQGAGQRQRVVGQLRARLVGLVLTRAADRELDDDRRHRAEEHHEQLSDRVAVAVVPPPPKNSANCAK